MPRQLLTPEEQQAALERRMQANRDDYVLPSETKVIHEGRPMQIPTQDDFISGGNYENPSQGKRYTDAPPAFIDPSKQDYADEGAKIIPIDNSELPTRDTMMAPPAQVFGQHAVTETRENDDIKEQIRKLEERIGSYGREAVPDNKTYADNSGNETFYVKNITNRHILIVEESIGIDKLNVGTSVDLLRHASLEDIKKSRTIRTLLYGIGKEKQLQRLTEQEYLDEKHKELANIEKINAMRRQEAAQANTTQYQQNVMPHERSGQFHTAQKIRPVIESKLGKLSLMYSADPETAKMALSPVEFVQWIQTEPLTHAEIEHILGDPAVTRNQNIKIALLEKKQQTPPS